MKTKDLSKLQSSLLNEVTAYGEVLERVVLVHFYKHYTSRPLSDNIQIITLPHIDPKTPLKLVLSIVTSYLVSIPILLRLALKYDVNLIRADDVITSGLPCILVSKILKRNSITCLLGDVEEVIKYKIGVQNKTLGIMASLVRRIEKFVISNSQACLVVTKGLEQKAKTLGSKKVFLTIPNMDLSIFRPIRPAKDTTTNLNVLFVGRLEPEKGPVNVLKVAEILKNVDFVIAGYGSLEKELRQLISDKGLSNVHLVGLVDHNNLPELYQRADVFLLPSYSEGLPVAMIEAMASEVPVIVSAVGAVEEVLKDNNGGFAVSPGNVEEIVSKIQILSKDSKLRAELGVRARINIECRFGNYIESQINIYRNITKI